MGLFKIKTTVLFILSAINFIPENFIVLVCRCCQWTTVTGDGFNQHVQKWHTFKV